MDPCTHKGCGAPFAPLTNPPGQQDIDALIVRVPRQAPARHAGARARRPSSLRPGRERYVDADRWPPAGTRYERLALGDGHARAASRAPAPATASVRHQPGRRLQPGVQPVRHGRRHARTCPPDQRLEGPHGLTFRTPPLDRAAARSPARSRCTSSRPRPRPTPTGTPSSPTSRPTAASRSSPRARCARRTARSTRRKQPPGAPVPPAHEPAADRAGPLLRLRHRDLADGVRARRRPPAPAAA